MYEYRVPTQVGPCQSQQLRQPASLRQGRMEVRSKHENINFSWLEKICVNMFLVLFSTHHNGFYIHETVGGSRWFFLVIALIAFSVTISEKRFWSIFSFVFFDLNLQGVPKKRTFRIAINKQPQVNPWPGDQGLTSCSESSGLTSNSESAFFGTPCRWNKIDKYQVRFPGMRPSKMCIISQH